MRIKKRDGSLEPFEIRKIHRALLMAMDAAHQRFDPEPIVHEICRRFQKIAEETLTIDDVHWVIEDVLRSSGYDRILFEYKTYRLERERQRAKRLLPDANALSDFIYYSKYARSHETYAQTLKRLNFWDQLPGDVQNHLYRREVVPSMRALQFGGRAIQVEPRRMFNCSYVNIVSWFDIAETFYHLLCGCGVGYSVRRHHVNQLPTIPKHIGVKHHTISDDIRGWRDALFILLVSSKYVEFNYSQIRDQGKPLVTSGGLAPGHFPLRDMLEQVRQIVYRAEGRQLRPIEVHDILCFAAQAVLSGGIRRSAMIALFDDDEMLHAKSRGNFDPVSGHNAQRAYANNSRVISDSAHIPHLIELATQNYGEPGYLYQPNPEMGVNPCGEINLAPQDGFAYCNLTEVVFTPDRDDFLSRCRAATIIGMRQASYQPEGEPLLGVSITGLMDHYHEVTPEILKAGRDAVYGLCDYARCTTIKPSGTASLFLGTSAGCHPRYARRYFRRVAGSLTDPVFHHLYKYNPHMFELEGDKCWAVFPVQAPDSAMTLEHLHVKQHLDFIKLLSENWLPHPKTGDRHNISCTLVVDDPNDIVDELCRFPDIYRAVSFVPPTVDKLYPHAPFEAVSTSVDEERWNYIIRNYRYVDYSRVDKTTRVTDTLACEDGRCQL